MPPGENMRCQYILSSLAAFFLHYGFELFFIEQANTKVPSKVINMEGNIKVVGSLIIRTFVRMYE